VSYFETAIQVVIGILFAVIPTSIAISMARGGWIAGLILAAIFIGSAFIMPGPELIWIQVAAGLALVITLRHRWPPTGTVAVMMLIYLAGQLAMMGIELGTDFNQTVLNQNEIQKALDSYIVLAQKSGASDPELLAWLKIHRESIAMKLWSMLPAMSIGFMLIISIMNLILSNSLTFQFGWGYGSGALRDYRLPDQVVFSLIIPAIFTLLPQNLHLFWPGWNILVLALLIYAFAGLGVIACYLRKWQLPAWFRGITYLFLVTQIFAVALPVIGIADIWVDFRTRIKKSYLKKDGEDDNKSSKYNGDEEDEQ